MFSVKFNEKSWSKKIKNLEEKTRAKVEDELIQVAENLSMRAPVDTGAYAESFSVVPASSGGGRSRSSKGRPRNQSVEQYRNIALQQMTADIKSLQLLENKSVSFRNRAPHAKWVENKYQIFGVTKDKFR